MSKWLAGVLLALLVLVTMVLQITVVGVFTGDPQALIVILFFIGAFPLVGALVRKDGGR